MPPGEDETEIVKFTIDSGGTLEFRRRGGKYFCLSCPSHKAASRDGLAWSSVYTNHGPLVHNLKLSRKMMTATTLNPVTCSTCSRQFRRATAKEDYDKHTSKCAKKKQSAKKTNDSKLSAPGAHDTDQVCSSSLSLLPRASTAPHRTHQWAFQGPVMPILELHTFFLTEVLARLNIFDFNMERVLNQVRVKLTEKEHVIENFGWSHTPFSKRSSADRPARLILHMCGGPVSYYINHCKQMVRERKMMTYLPFDVSDEELRWELERCKLSSILHNLLLRGLSMNYVLIIGTHSRVLWRMW
jgi:hypothetical protein